MRGKLQAGIDLLIALGITPADAGKTPESLFSMVRLQDHPRGCGENSAAKHLTSAGTGSPPRMRGKRCGLYKVLYRFRITPADAGKTDIQRAAGSIIRDHPRGCGENAYFRSDEDAERGSPPRMRGKLTIHVRYLQTVGITPADAGKTAKKRVRRRYTRDHPRGCGENCISRSIGTVQVGSPPRMRGKLCGGSHSHIARRDHPRGCGENVTAYDPAMSGTGSPPRMRGKRGRRVQENAGGRITPADAGKTGGDMQIRVIVRDHPRGCGENFVICTGPHNTTGSPPRMRGKRKNQGRNSDNQGITPADAGKTITPFAVAKRAEDHPRGCGENGDSTSLTDVQKRITPADAGKTVKSLYGSR